ncbi:hypothetical protein [Nannocystis sp.]|uniref:hypothetical protein n=1 Tax=Nannocystis sp. TaxID=1962667 RepID=UPI0025FAA346|nr:hypothetical protein [Nannocystis sp.]MBK7828116.1 hypothetical protein [Nannocystis sp.]
MMHRRLLAIFCLGFASAGGPAPCVDNPYAVAASELYGTWKTPVVDSWQGQVSFEAPDKAHTLANCFNPQGDPVSCGNSSIGGDATFVITGNSVALTIDPSTVGPLLSDQYSVFKNSCTNLVTLRDGSGGTYTK